MSTATDWLASKLKALEDAKPEARPALFTQIKKRALLYVQSGELNSLTESLLEVQAERFHLNRPRILSEQKGVSTSEISVCTDLANADRIRRKFGDRLRHTASLGWMFYDGTNWRKDECLEVMAMAQEAAVSIRDEVKELEGERAEKLAKWGVRSQSTASVTAAIKQARALPPIAAHIDDFDSDKMLLNCRNGVLDLNTYTLVPHSESLTLHTMTAGASYVPEAKCYGWTKFLKKILPDKEIRDFVQRFAGYTLTGTTGEQCFVFLWGLGANGKSTMMEVLAHVMGTYESMTPFDTIRRRNQGQATNDLARLRGARMVRASEPDKDVRLSESLIKQITGGEKVTARFLRREFFEFHPHFKLWFAGNHEPRISGSDHGIWRRVLKIPFTVRIPKAEQVDQDELIASLLGEREGILNWMVEGLKEWQQYGLTPPEEVRRVTQEYRENEDPFGSFIADCCEVNAADWTRTSDLWETWKRWSDGAGEDTGTKRMLCKTLRELGFAQKRNNQEYGFAGLGLKAGEVAMNQPEYEGDGAWTD